MTKPLLFSVLFMVYTILFGASFGITSMFIPIDVEQTFLSGEIATVIVSIGIICRQSMTIWQLNRSPSIINQH